MRFTTFALAMLVATAAHADLRVVGYTNVFEGADMIEEAVNASQIADGLTTAGALSREDVSALATSGAPTEELRAKAREAISNIFWSCSNKKQ